MTEQALPQWIAADVALVRMPVTSAGPPDGISASFEDILRGSGGDPPFVDAVTVANPSVASALVAAADDRLPATMKKVRRAALAAAAYRKRMAARTTPHGLFAGVALAGFGPAEFHSLGESPVVTADQQWLVSVVRAIEGTIEVGEDLSVTTDPRLYERAGRFVCPAQLITATPGGEDSGGWDSSVRATPGTRALLDAARTGTTVTALSIEVAAARGAATATVRRAIAELVTSGFLRTTLLPPADASLSGIAAHLNMLGLPTWRDRFDAVAALAHQVEAADRGKRRLPWLALTAAMRDLHPSDEPPARVDTRIDARIALPPQVADEATRTAGLLWRLFGAPGQSSGDLRRWFLHTHGVDRLVPVRELLDETVSGPVLGFLHDAPTACDTAPSWRTQLIGQFLHDALTNGTSVDLTDVDLVPVGLTASAASAPADSKPQAEPQAVPPAVPPVSVDLFAHLTAADIDALRTGAFTLVEPRFGPGVGGATAARFAHLLDTTAVAAFVATSAPAGGSVYAEVDAAPLHARSRNVHRVTGWVGHRICCDRPPADDTDLALDDLLVGAVEDRMFLVSQRLGCLVTPVAFHRLNRDLLSPAARLLLAIGAEDSGEVHGWSWGPYADMPYLPPVVFGRSLLSPATWRIPANLTRPDIPDRQWLTDLREWAKAMELPDTVTVGGGDKRLPLRLADDIDALLLRRELRTSGTRTVHEHIGCGGWADGRPVEIVLPLRTVQERRPAPARARRVLARFPAAHLQLPGGRCLSAELDVPERLQNHVLRQLPAGPTDALGGADRWFFIRYFRDGLVLKPHLRLRVFGPADYLAGTVYPWLHTWAGQLRNDGLAGDLRLTPFDAEVERYGGPQVYPTVEALAHADSLAVLETLRADRYGLADLPVLALSCLDLLRAVDPAGIHRGWLRHLQGHPDPRWRADVRAHAASGWFPAAIGPAADDAWTARRASAAEVAAAIAVQEATAERCWSPPARIVESIVHLHCNRMVGRDAVLERAALRLVRDASAALAATHA